MSLSIPLATCKDGRKAVKEDHLQNAILFTSVEVNNRGGHSDPKQRPLQKICLRITAIGCLFAVVFGRLKGCKVKWGLRLNICCKTQVVMSVGELRLLQYKADSCIRVLL